jgi:hypothetical protein
LLLQRLGQTLAGVLERDGLCRNGEPVPKSWRNVRESVLKPEALHAFLQPQGVLENLRLSHFYPSQLKFISSSVARNTSVEMANLLLFSAVE